MDSQISTNWKRDLIKLLTDSVKRYRVRELRECIETYGRPTAPLKTARKAYLLRYVTALLRETGQRWEGVLPLHFVTKILELECRARNDFAQRFRRLNTTLVIEESPFYEVLHVATHQKSVRSGDVHFFKIPVEWNHIFSEEMRRCRQQPDRGTCEVQLLFEPQKEGEGWEEIPLRLAFNESFEDRLEIERAVPIVYVTEFFRDPGVPDAFARERQRIDIDFPSKEQEEEFRLSMSVRLVRRLSVPQLTKGCPVVKTCRLVYLLNDFFDRSGFMACTVSLFSTFEEGRSVMEVPCRGSGCAHPDVFDLEPFLRGAQHRLAWTCPVCLRPLDYSTLEVDGFFQSFRELSGKLNYTFKKDNIIPILGEIATITLE